MPRSNKEKGHLQAWKPGWICTKHHSTHDRDCGYLGFTEPKGKEIDANCDPIRDEIRKDPTGLYCQEHLTRWKVDRTGFHKIADQPKETDELEQILHDFSVAEFVCDLMIDEKRDKGVIGVKEWQERRNESHEKNQADAISAIRREVVKELEGLVLRCLDCGRLDNYVSVNTRNFNWGRCACKQKGEMVIDFESMHERIWELEK